MTLGYIARHYEVVCGICGKHADLDTSYQRQSKQAARDRGWMLTKKCGWICQDCSEFHGPRAI